MSDAQPKNVSLRPEWLRSIQEEVESSRSPIWGEALREALRRLDQPEHRELLEQWLYEGLSPRQGEQLPPEVIARAREIVREWAINAWADGRAGDVRESSEIRQ